MLECKDALVAKSGSRIIRVNCLRKGHQWFRRQVTKSICQKCLKGIPPEKPKEAQEAHTEPLTITPLGTLIYAQTGWEPPPCPPGYHRRSSHLRGDDVWVLEPDSPLCKHLGLSQGERGSCGYYRVKRRCRLIDSFVGPRTCGTCQRRE